MTLKSKSKLEQVLDIIQHEPNYETFEYKGYKVVIKRMMHFGGQLNGYVRIPVNHPYYDKDFTSDDLENIQCHGGLTFSGELEGETGFFIGFDTAHYQDYMPFLQMNLSTDRTMNDGTYKDITYVRNECKHIVDQLLSL
jgi:hypothetical protein